MSTGAAQSFEIAAVEAFHVVAADQHYWQGFRADNRGETARFILKPGWRTVYARHVETCLVKVTLRSGQIGWGESTEPICPELVAQLATELIAPLACGQSFSSVADFTAFGFDLNRGRGHQSGYLPLAIAAFDIALCDALASRAGVPLAGLFADNPAPSLPVYLSGLRRATRDERAVQLANAYSEGVRAAKIFVDADNAETLAEFDVLRRSVPDDCALMVDALWSYNSVETAGALARELARRGARWLECPLVPEDIVGHVALRRQTDLPIALGETFFNAYQLRDWIDAGAFDIYQPDIGRTGFAGGIAQARMVSAAGLGLTPHMGTGSPIIQAAALHFHAAACGGLPCEYQIDLADLLPGCFSSLWQIRGGQAERPTVAGLGVQVDEIALAQHTALATRHEAD